jgi:hypothetical protein
MDKTTGRHGLADRATTADIRLARLVGTRKSFAAAGAEEEL